MIIIINVSDIENKKNIRFNNNDFKLNINYDLIPYKLNNCCINKSNKIKIKCLKYIKNWIQSYPNHLLTKRIVNSGIILPLITFIKQNNDIKLQYEASFILNKLMKCSNYLYEIHNKYNINKFIIPFINIITSDYIGSQDNGLSILSYIIHSNSENVNINKDLMFENKILDAMHCHSF